MSFQGSLDTVGLSDVFQLFAFSRKSGALHLRSEAGHGIVYFEDGEVYYGTAAPTEGIGNLLVKAGLVSPEQWKEVLSSSGDGGQGELLTGQDGVDAGAIEAFVEDRVEDAIFRLMQWEEGEFELEDEVHPLGPVFKFACDPLLAEGERRLEIWRDIRESIPSTSMGVRLDHHLPGEVDVITMTRDEWRLVAAISSGTSIVDLAASLGETEFKVVQALHELISRGLVELISEEKLAVIRTLVGDTLSADAEYEAAATATAEAALEAVTEVEAVPEVPFEAAAEVTGDAASSEEPQSVPDEAGTNESVEALDAVVVSEDAADPESDVPSEVDGAPLSFEQMEGDVDSAEVQPDADGDGGWAERLEEPIPEGAAAYADPGAVAAPETPQVSLADMAAQAEAEGTVDGAEYEAEYAPDSAGSEYADPDAAPQDGFYDQRATIVNQGTDTGVEAAPVDQAYAPGADPAVAAEAHHYHEAGASEVDGGVAADGDSEGEDGGDAEDPGDGSSGDSNELDKSLILRLIAGVRSL